MRWRWATCIFSARTAHAKVQTTRAELNTASAEVLLHFMSDATRNWGYHLRPDHNTTTAAEPNLERYYSAGAPRRQLCSCAACTCTQKRQCARKPQVVLGWS